MKELSIEEKVKAYDEVLERAKNIYGASECKDILCTLENIFPELKKSEDEKIKKEIYEALKFLETECSWDTLGEVDILDAYAWLEKQNQVKDSFISRHENKTCKENDEIYD